ncbi:IucA/IucC family siderophore biosynthesis protein [Arthrobacter sp. zg-Y820]|uniref:IucA/IucC family protein n=1 Tax=unclassified Arthrobacter TaxID=235627 RepID=UPI001E29A3B1|nr:MULTISPECIES: IucA/IucC family siderophore biosynthesis protein [unclassified Arthrobacter]MCC9198317.1 IucA/IucC family siderophore biosynthesis protein [Arthrobacter sp. zg-Y820]MDK1281187.1 IucA/IucC family siderophore biosynthesis protein [Arthrobacter sp. zg.Y820]WIB11030.1 IucA/IucC family siderophore biosynthesis protein [Arthrobacter sp. zg-Y820]
MIFSNTTSDAIDFPAEAPAGSTTAHLTPERWATANRHLIRKALAEFSHERILAPEPVSPAADTAAAPATTRASAVMAAGPARATEAAYRLVSDDGGAEYRFAARLLELDHWSIPAASIQRFAGGTETSLDALVFITEFSATLGINDQMLPVYLEEISSTLASHAFKNYPGAPSSDALARGATKGLDPAADFQAVERSMIEGHPCFVANNGRLGFGSDDYLAYAPEAGAPVHLEWIAVRRDRSVFTSLPGLDYRTHLENELGAAAVAGFDARLGSLGADAADYLYMPVHPWQWTNKLTVTFAAEIAQGHLVHLGTGDDMYQAQQSIRTFFNRDRTDRCYVKTALSVVNMGFMRGLSPEYMLATPAINDWLDGLVRNDKTLQAAGFSILRENAAVGYTNRYFEAGSPKGSAYRKMLSALWRESPLERLDSGEQLATMASLLHTDAGGRPLASALIEQSGLGAQAWLEQYLRAYLVPLLHCFYAYELAFMPHGENLIMVLRNGAVQRMIMKDIAEEIVVMGDRTPLPEDCTRVRIDIPQDDKVLSIFTDVFDCIFRFLAALLEEDGQLETGKFWETVASLVLEYQDAHPELAAEFATHDLFAEDFVLSCLNRLQLRNNQQMLDLSDPSGGLQFSGRLDNPLARFRR